MKPYRHKGLWCVQWPSKLSPNGRRSQQYFKTEEDAQKAVDRRLKEWAKEGRRFVTDEERDAIAMARRYLDGNLGRLGEVLEHWRKTGPTAITPTVASKAVEQFQKFRMPLVSRRTQDDIKSTLKAFVQEFGAVELHQITPGDLERWMYSVTGWSARGRYKRVGQFMAWAARHRLVAENPVSRIPAPQIPPANKEIYTGNQLFDLLVAASVESDETPWLLPFMVLQAFCFCRASEIVPKYDGEDVIHWSDFDWPNNVIHIRESVGKRTRRQSGNERLIPIQPAAQSWLADYRGRNEQAPVVPLKVHQADIALVKFHAACGIRRIHNGLRRSAISYYLAVHPETGIGQLARWCGNSESVVRAHYWKFIRPDQGAAWFRTLRKPDGKADIEELAKLAMELGQELA